MEVNTRKILNKLKRLFNVKEDIELVEILNVSVGTIYSWKNRDNIDLTKVISSLSKIEDIVFLFSDDDAVYLNNERYNSLLQENEQLKIKLAKEIEDKELFKKMIDFLMLEKNKSNESQI